MCDDPLLPEPLARALSDYRALRDAHGPCWGEPPLSYVTQAWATVFLDPRYDFWSTGLRQVAERYPDLPPQELEDHLGEVDVDRVVRDALAGDVVDNLPALRLTSEGFAVEADTRVVLGDASFRTALLLDSSVDEPVTVVVDGAAHEVPPRGAKIVEVAGEVRAGGALVDLSPLARRVPAAAIRVRAGFPCRWSVTSANGQGWYPEGAPPKVDSLRRPYFHGDDLVVAVPAEPVTVTVTRGMEYTSAEVRVTPEPGGETLVELAPERLYDAAARGWYGGDLHVHLNWMGEEPAAPALAAATPPNLPQEKKGDPAPDTKVAQDLLARGRYEDAIRQSKLALGRDERYVPAMIVMAKAYYHLGKYELAGSIVELAKSIDPNGRNAAECYDLQGFLSLTHDDRISATAAFKKSTEADPSFGPAFVNLTAQYLYAKNYDGAVQSGEQAARLLPNSARAHLDLGSAYRGKLRYADAEKEYKRAGQLDPSMADVYFNLGILYLDAKEMPGPGGQPMDLIAKLNVAIQHLNRYKQLAGYKLTKDDPADTYLNDARTQIEREQKRQDRMRRQQERNQPKGATPAPAPAAPPAKK